MSNNPPPEVAAAAAIVDRWLKGQPSVVAGRPQEPVKKMSDAERLDYCRQHDQSNMPPNPYDVERAKQNNS